jgi:hypothetical protein
MGEAKRERADVVAFMRWKARIDHDKDEDWATTTYVWADVIELGGHEGAAAVDGLGQFLRSLWDDPQTGFDWSAA